MSNVTPLQVLEDVAKAVPAECRSNIVVIGSLAAGYHYFGSDQSKAVRTKDVDCVLEPFHAAVGAGQSIARKLLDAGWVQQASANSKAPGDSRTPVEELPVIRLYPPRADPNSEQAWFIELLTVPESAAVNGKEWMRLELPEGHFGLPTFRFLSITAHNPRPVADLGIRYARPENMALANLLEHPEIKPTTMSSLFAERAIKRSNKDLGRVLAIAILAALDDYRSWAEIWKDALTVCFPNEWKGLALRAGTGLRALLASQNDLAQAMHTCVNGLLASQPPTLDAMTAAGERLLGDAVETLERSARS